MIRTCRHCGKELELGHSGACPFCGKHNSDWVVKSNIAIGLSLCGATARLKDMKKRTILKTTLCETKDERTIKRTLKGEKRALQIKWEDNKIVHLHCKSCDNSWEKTTDGQKELNNKFEIKDDIVKCVFCRREWAMGGRAK